MLWCQLHLLVSLNDAVILMQYLIYVQTQDNNISQIIKGNQFTGYIVLLKNET